MQSTLLLTIHQCYSSKNTRRDTQKTRGPFLPNWKQQKTHLSRPKSIQKTKKNQKNFSMKVSGKSHSAENPKKSSMLAKHFVSSENWLRRKQFRKKSHRKNTGLKKKQNSDIAC